MDLLKEAEKNGVRDLAKKKDKSKKELVKELKKQGFSTIKDFFGKKPRNSIKLDYELSEMEKRKLQGMFGEKIATFVEGRIKEFIQESMGPEWEIKKGIKVRAKGETEKSMFYGLKPDEHSKIKCSGKTVAHAGLSREEIKEEVESMHFHVSERLFKKFQEYQAPSIDECYYAIKKSGETREHFYRAHNRSSGSYDVEGEKIACELEKLEDFKIICLEVKTTTEKGSNLLSSTQREVRDLAQETAFLDFYMARVAYDISSSRIPESVEVKIEDLEVS
ncbi:MAG: hypothetical protein ABEJ36_02950 [Candidatus Nanosalina sp.]